MTHERHPVPADRYGRRPSQGRRRAVVAGLGVLAALGVAVVVAIGLRMADQPVRTQTVGYQVHDAGSVEVVFDVTMAPGSAARCTVEALNLRHAQVGVRDVEVGPSDVPTQRVTALVATSEEAVTGVVDRCDPLD